MKLQIKWDNEPKNAEEVRARLLESRRRRLAAGASVAPKELLTAAQPSQCDENPVSDPAADGAGGQSDIAIVDPGPVKIGPHLYDSTRTEEENIRASFKTIYAVIEREGGNISIRMIIKIVAFTFGLTPIQIESPVRYARVVRPRQIAMTIAKRIKSQPLGEIGRRFGGRDHTTVLHAVRKLAPIIDPIIAVTRPQPKAPASPRIEIETPMVIEPHQIDFGRQHEVSEYIPV